MQDLSLDISLTVFYAVITLMLNPLIYSLKNSELTNAMKRLWRKKKSYQAVDKCIICHDKSNLAIEPIILECKSFHKSDANIFTLIYLYN